LKKDTPMHPFPKASKVAATERHVLLAYVADLELEVERLRTQSQFVGQRPGRSSSSPQPRFTPWRTGSQTRSGEALSRL
jgi:hypothetical protein